MGNPNKVLKKYYLFGFPLFLLLFLISRFFNFDFFYSSQMLIGFAWGYALNAPGMRERLNQKKLRYSFIVMAFKAQLIIEELLESKNSFAFSVIKRQLAFFIFSLVLMGITSQWNILYPLVGVISYETFHYFWESKNLGKIPS